MSYYGSYYQGPGCGYGWGCGIFRRLGYGCGFRGYGYDYCLPCYCGRYWSSGFY